MQASSKPEQALAREVEALRDRCAALERDARAIVEDMEIETAERVKVEREIAKVRGAGDELLASMRDEVRSPLNALLALTERALALADPAEVGEYMRLVNGAAKALLANIDTLLDLPRGEADEFTVHEQEFELAGVLEKIASPFRTQAREKGLRLTVRIGSGVPAWVCADLDKLGRILANLLSNAITFTESGEVAVSAMLGNRGEKRLMLLFCVRDTGLGIPEDMQRWLFNSRCRLEGSPAKEPSGTGPGLASAKRLVELLGGEIWVESMPGRGSSFTFSLPVTGLRQPAPDADAITRPTHGLKDIEPLSLLLAEDNRINQFFLKDYFEALGHTVGIAENGTVVLEMLKAKPYDLILMDIQMPHMDGLEATRIIRASTGEPWASIPIVALTAYALSQDRHEAMEAGMDAYVPKPINFEELEREIVRALRKTEKGARRDEIGSSRQPAPSQNEVIRRMFLTEVPQRQEAICAYLEAEDLEGLSGEAHGLRNGAHFAGATEIYDLSTELENAVRQGRRDEALASARRLLEMLGEYVLANS